MPRPKASAWKPLNPPESRFVAEYLIDGNAMRAYRVAYPKNKYPKPGVARLLKKRNVKAQIHMRMAQVTERLAITHERVIQELARVAFADVRHLFDPSGQVLSPAKLDAVMAAAVQSFEVSTDAKGTTTVKVKLNDKVVSLVTLLKNTKPDGTPAAVADAPPPPPPAALTIDVSNIANLSDEAIEKTIENIDKLIAGLGAHEAAKIIGAP